MAAGDFTVISFEKLVDQFHAESATKRKGQPPLVVLKVFAFLKEAGQFFADGEWANAERGISSLSPRLSKNFAWAVDESNQQAPVTAYMANYRLAFGEAATDSGVRFWVFERAAVSSSSAPSHLTEEAAVEEGGEAGVAVEGPEGGGEPAAAAVSLVVAQAAMPLMEAGAARPLVAAPAAASPPALTPAAAARLPSEGGSASSSNQMRTAAWGTGSGSNKKAKGAQPTLAYRLYDNTSSELNLTLLLEHLSARDKLQAVFNVSEFTVEVRVKRRVELPQLPLLQQSGGGFETSSWRGADYLTTGPVALHNLGSEWALDGVKLGEASSSGESQATKYEIGKTSLEMHGLLHVADGGGGAQLTVPLLVKKTGVEQGECTPSPPAARSRLPLGST